MIEERKLHKRRGFRGEHTPTSHSTMSSSTISKRKRTQKGRFEISSAPYSTTEASVTPKVTTATYSRSDSGRLASTLDSSALDVSPEDLAILRQHPKFNLPTDSLLDFEQLVHDTINPVSQPDDDVPSHVVMAKVSIVISTIANRFSSLYCRKIRTRVGCLTEINIWTNSCVSMVAITCPCRAPSAIDRTVYFDAKSVSGLRSSARNAFSSATLAFPCIGLMYVFPIFCLAEPRLTFP